MPNQFLPIALVVVSIGVSGASAQSPASPDPRLLRIEATITRYRPNGPSELVSSPTMIAANGERASMSLGIDGKLDLQLAVLPRVQADGKIALEIEHDAAAGNEIDRLVARRTVAAGQPITVYGSDLSIIQLTVRRL